MTDAARFKPRSESDVMDLLGRFSIGTAEWERRELLAMPDEIRSLVLRRVDVLERYLSQAKRTAASAEVAAEVLGMPRSNFYRMLSRYRQVGAALGLVPHARVKKPGSRAGGSYDFAAELARLVRDNPEAKLAFFIAELEKSLPAREGVRVPSRPTVQRRIAQLRSATQAPPRASVGTRGGVAVFGRDILIDGCALGVRVRANDGPFGERLAIAFVLDLETRIVLGVGLGRFGGGEALRSALADMDRFWEDPLVGGFATVRMPERVEWTVPQGMEDLEAGFEDTARLWKVEAVATAAPGRVHGARIRDVVGPEFGYYPLIAYADAPDWAGSLPSERPLVTIAGTLSKAIDEWNMEIVRRREGARLVLRGRTWDKRLEDWTRRDRVSDLDGNELSLLLTGDSLPAAAREGSVRHVWRSWLDWAGSDAQT